MNEIIYVPNGGEEDYMHMIQLMACTFMAMVCTTIYY